MKAILRVISLIVALVIITACSSNETNHPPASSSNNESSANDPANHQSNEENRQPEENNTSNNHSDDKPKGGETQQEIINSIAEQETTSFSFDLPKALPMDEGKYLTGTTNSKEGKFDIDFYQTDEEIPPNDKQLEEKDIEKVAHIQIEQYESEEAAEEEIGFEDFSKAGGEEIDLGHDLTGFQDAGAGSLFTSWNEGRWALAARSRTEDKEQGTELARDAVDYLESHRLPAPNQYGKVQLDVENDGTVVKWQKANIVYRIDQVQEPLDALQIATAFD